MNFHFLWKIDRIKLIYIFENILASDKIQTDKFCDFRQTDKKPIDLQRDKKNW